MGRLEEALKEYKVLTEYHDIYENDRKIRERINDISQEITDVQASIDENQDILKLSTKQLNCMANSSKLECVAKKLSKEQIENLSARVVGCIIDKLTLEQLKYLPKDTIEENLDKLRKLTYKQYRTLEESDKLSELSMKDRIKLSVVCRRNKDKRRARILENINKEAKDNIIKRDI